MRIDYFDCGDYNRTKIRKELSEDYEQNLRT